MTIDFFLNAALGLLPVLFYLGVLIHFDSFRLVRLSLVLYTIAAGAAVAVAAYFINTFLMRQFGVGFEDYMHFGAPFVEELCKAIIIVILIWTSRIGFAFDSAILGFAVGAGFALTENFFYLRFAADQQLAVWVIRGFGTAFMHGATTAFFAVLGHVLTLHDQRNAIIKYMPGLAAAIFAHSIFNFFLAYPVASTVFMAAALPVSLLIFLHEDEKTIHDWLKVDFEAHQKLLEEIKSGEFEKSRAGQFLNRMNEGDQGAMAAKLAYYLQVHTELILSAETILAAHESGEDIAIDDAVRQKLILLHELESEIGKTAMLAMRPHLHFNRHELWEIYMLEKEAGFRHPRPH